MIQGKTENGLLYAVKRTSSAAAYCALSIKCGTRDEGSYPSGIAHFTEHTIFKGTKRKTASQINNYLDKLGGELNAYTTKEEIVVHATVLKEDLDKAVSLLLELATSPTFPKKKIETERGVIIDEINSYKDNPADEIYDNFEEKLFCGHDLGRSILGTASTVKKITSNDLHNFVNEMFTPDRMAFTIVANLDEQKMVDNLQKKIKIYFEDFTFKKTNLPPDTGNKFPPAERFEKTIEKHNHQANVVLGGLAPSLYEEKERLAAVLLSNILGGQASNSLLNDILREKNGWVYGVECLYTQYKDCGVMAICLGCDKENLNKCFNAIDRTIEKIRTKPLSDRFLKAAKRQLIGQLVISADSGETQCQSMGKSLLAFEKIKSDGYTISAIESITAEELMSIAQSIFSPEKLSKLIYL